MIQYRADAPAAALPWASAQDTRNVVFCTLWTTGPDTGLDSVFRMLAMRPVEGGGWELFDRVSRPFANPDEDAAATARVAREYGMSGADFEGAEAVESAWSAFDSFVGEGPLVVSDGSVFTTWFEHLAGEVGRTPTCIGLDELAGLLVPGRLSGRKERLVAALLSGSENETRAQHPPELMGALAELVGRFHALDPRVIRVAAAGYARAWDELRTLDPPAAQRLALALELVEHPSTWARSTGELFAAPESLADGRLTESLAVADGDGDLLAGLVPRAATAVWHGIAPVPPASDDPTPFDAADERLLDDLFRVHLPALFGAGKKGASDSYRESQHQVAREVARTLGTDELFLVHAPTGTGKTLAYLLPALLWARRNGVRVGVATYTRALQEQAMDREVPRALAALSLAGEPDGFRVSVLKGRNNYVCWRALRLLTPASDDGAEAWLAWTSLALFSLTDVDGDLNRFPLRPPLRLLSSKPYRKVLLRFIRLVRAQTGCCTHAEDRKTCAAELARRRAERSHVVLANQTFTLARQEFFKHVVFDECEHLHEQAHNAWSHALTFRGARDVLLRLHRPEGGSSRAPLDRLARLLVIGTPGHAAWERSMETWEVVAAGLHRLEDAVDAFEAWRQEARKGRDGRDEHSLLREYVEGPDSGELVEARRIVTAAGNKLDAALSEIGEHLDQFLVKGRARIRRGLDLGRTDLAELLVAVEAWIPLEEGRPAFRKETFYDVETNSRGEAVLSSRVLLPDEYLGRNYYPGLKCAVFLSATTWIGGGFDAAKGYLGLDRAESPAEEEHRPGRTVRTFRAPEVFDYSRVVVAVPRDAPSYTHDKGPFLAYVRRFIAWLGERTRGRMLVLFTNARDVKLVGEELLGFFRARHIPFWYQGMEGAEKEELSDLFRSRVDSILLGVDTFWYGADFPGETLEYLVIVKLPYGVPDRYHHAQRAALGENEHRQRIYLPRALAKFRQGFGRLLRKKSDRGCVFVLDGRVLEPRHRGFLRELPLDTGGFAPSAEEGGARFVRGDSERCMHEALAHMDMLSDIRRRGLDLQFGPRRAAPEPPPILDIPREDLPF